jgi:hypothetical protein
MDLFIKVTCTGFITYVDEKDDIKVLKDKLEKFKNLNQDDKKSQVFSTYVINRLILERGKTG